MNSRFQCEHYFCWPNKYDDKTRSIIFLIFFNLIGKLVVNKYIYWFMYRFWYINFGSSSSWILDYSWSQKKGCTYCTCFLFLDFERIRWFADLATRNCINHCVRLMITLMNVFYTVILAFLGRGKHCSTKQLNYERLKNNSTRM